MRLIILVKIYSIEKAMSGYDKHAVESMVTDKVFHFMMHAATREDVGALRQEMKSESVRLETKMDASFEKLDSKIDASFEKLDSKIDASYAKLDSKIDKMIWGFVGITGAIITAVSVQIIVHFIH